MKSFTMEMVTFGFQCPTTSPAASCMFSSSACSKLKGNLREVSGQGRRREVNGMGGGLGIPSQRRWEEGKGVTGMAGER